ncbi:PP2C family protein-serine/threonine phosphatase [Streptomyces sp. NPDC058045]|uniref:PP2C family protein-serine/threonine phosphatase n=1 Tax=Streptomyces sp. NPDC058045 TaxID=3346311 RepID=UPI0036E94A02
MASESPGAGGADELLDRLGSLTAQARERAELHRARVELAFALQREMLPGPIPVVPGLRTAVRYAPAHHGLNVGGDWYDGFLLPDGSLGFTIGDVQGHNIEAAAFMGQVRIALRALASVVTDPGELLSRANELLLSNRSELFATCTFVRFDPHTWTVQAARAGHVPMVQATADGRAVVVTDNGGPPLGIQAGMDYPVSAFGLDGPGALVLLTDGVVEGPSMTMDEGLEQVTRLAGLGSAVALNAEPLATAVMKIAGSVGHEDDAAVLVVCHDAPPPARGAAALR